MNAAQGLDLDSTNIATFVLRSLISAGLLLTVLHGQPPQGPERPQHQPTIAFVQNGADFDGTGCSLWLNNDRLFKDKTRIFLRDLGDRAVMNIGGSDKALMLVESFGVKDELKKGSRSTYRYRGDAVEVVVRYVVTGLCAPNDESCEVVNYDAVVTVITRSGKRTLRAHGICGS